MKKTNKRERPGADKKRPLAVRRAFKRLAVRLGILASTKFDYKDTTLLRQFMSETGRIMPRRMTGLSAKQQRSLAAAIKRARHIALLPFAAPHAS